MPKVKNDSNNHTYPSGSSRFCTDEEYEEMQEQIYEYIKEKYEKSE